MLSEEQQSELRRLILGRLATQNRYEQARLEIQFKQDLIAVAAEMALPAHEAEVILSTEGLQVFQHYALGNAGNGVGLFALVRTYGRLRGADEAAAMRDRMQALAEENALRGS